MKQIHYRNSLRVLGTLGTAVALTVLLLLVLRAADGPAHATGQAAIAARDGAPAPVAPAPRPSRLSLRPQEAITLTPNAPPLPDWVLELMEAGRVSTAADEVSIAKLARTGSGEDGTVHLGDRITFTLVLTNNDPGTDATDVLILDVLPEGILEQDVGCSGCTEITRTEMVTFTWAKPLTSTFETTCMDVVTRCEVSEPPPCLPTQTITETVEISCTGVLTTYTPEPVVGAVTYTHQLSWTVGRLAPGKAGDVSFWLRVTGQPDGAVVRNRAFVRYRLNGLRSAMSNETETTVRIPVPPTHTLSLSPAPTWLSPDAWSSSSMDWGDFDGDGWLDLALGSSFGATVYRNECGRLERFWGTVTPTLDVRWADLVGDREPELVTILDTLGGLVFQAAGDSLSVVPAPDLPFEWVAPGDYDGDGSVDLIASSDPTSIAWYDLDGTKVRDVFSEDVQTTTELTLYLEGLWGSRAKYYERRREARGRVDKTSAAGDYDNNGYLDLAVGHYVEEYLMFQWRYCSYTWLGTVTCEPWYSASYPRGIKKREFWVLLNQGPGPADTLATTVGLLSSPPADAASGDYDGDGYLDIAIALPSEDKVDIYHNELGKSFTPGPSISATAPRALAWGDFDRDGDLDLAVGLEYALPRVYLNSGGSFADDRFVSPPAGAVSGVIYSDAAAAVDSDNDGDLDLALTNYYGPSLLFTSFAPVLSPTLHKIDSFQTSSVAWGDADGDGDLDLLFGAGWTEPGARIYENLRGTFSAGQRKSFPNSGFGPHGVAFGDMDGDGDLDVALGMGTRNQIYLAGNAGQPDWESGASRPSYSVSWGDSDGDGDLDLLFGNSGSNALYLNQGGRLAASPTWTSVETDTTRSVAWGYLDGDPDLDLAAGNDGQPVRVYRNNRDNTFRLEWEAPYISSTYSVAWGDFDGDGDMDLAVGNRGQPNCIYENDAGELGKEPVWVSTETSNTTSLAWGDWDNDGDLDLAVGNYGQRDQVYLNRGSKPGVPRLEWLWSSKEISRTTGLAWGDRDRDGDLDLAVSGDDGIGYYENTYVMPSHLDDDFARTMPLPNNPSYLFIARPHAPGGSAADDAYFFSSPERLGGLRQSGEVEIDYWLYDPDGTRASTASNEPGDEVISTTYEFSLDGGGTWHPAKPVAGWPGPVATTRRLGQPAVFSWAAADNAAISDDARFRITIVQGSQTGPIQRASVSAISPPFRVRATTCEWPEGPEISIEQTENPFKYRFVGSVSKGSGVLTFKWDFGDGNTKEGQAVWHTYDEIGDYQIRLEVTSEPCPRAKTVATTEKLSILPNKAYLPLAHVGYSTAAKAETPENAPGRHQNGSREPRPTTIASARTIISRSGGLYVGSGIVAALWWGMTSRRRRSGK
jgi:uncharacterized repeat protein (TIGR01451 family)